MCKLPEEFHAPAIAAGLEAETNFAWCYFCSNKGNCKAGFKPAPDLELRMAEFLDHRTSYFDDASSSRYAKIVPTVYSVLKHFAVDPLSWPDERDTKTERIAAVRCASRISTTGTRGSSPKSKTSFPEMRRR